jgi:hypothetical protein
LDPVPRTQPYAPTPPELILIHLNLGHTYHDEWLITYPIYLSFFSDIQDSNNIEIYYEVSRRKRKMIIKIIEGKPGQGSLIDGC